MGFRTFFKQSANLQVARAGSLLLLDILTTVPNAVVTNELAQFIPFSVGALIVLSVFSLLSPSHRDSSHSLLGTFNFGIQDSAAVPIGGMQSLVVLSSRSSRVPAPLILSQPTLPLSSGTTGEKPMDGTGTSVEEEVALESPFVPTRPRSQAPVPVLVPSSAPPRIGDASVFDSQQKRQILPFQVQYAERFERQIHTGPIVMPIRTKRPRPHVQVVIEDIEQTPKRTQKSSSLIGSDIVRMQSASGVSVKTEKKPWSPDNVTPSDYTNSQSSQFTPVTRTPTTYRDSAMSMPFTPHNRSISSGSRAILSTSSSRQPSRRKIKSPAEVSTKLPWRSAPRQSYSSAMTFGGAREELSIVVEGQAESSRSRPASRSSLAAKRMVISRPHSLRSTRPSSPQPSPLGKQLPGIPSVARPSSSQHLTVPDQFRSPDTLESPSGSPIRPSSQYIVTESALPTSPPSGSYERALGSGRLRGPRTPPASSSTPNLRSGWPKVGMPIAGPVRMNSRHSRRRSGSCPELPPLDMGSATLRPIGPIQRESPPGGGEARGDV